VDFDPVLDNALAAGNPIPDELQSKAAARLALGDARKPLPAEIQALFPSSFILTEEMGWIPEGWEVVTLNSITTELKRGISPKYLETGGVQVVNQRCIRNHEINFNLCRRHDDVKKKIDNQYIKIGDVLINSTGVGTLGRVAQVSDLLEPAIVDSHITIVRVEEEQYLPYSFGQMIITKENIIEAMGEGSTGQTELSRKNLAELIVLKPNLKILEQSDKGIKGYIDKIGINNKQISILTKLRDTLLPKLLSGELRIPDAENLAAEVL
jgi:type I restriction enzyme S subunit